MPDRSVGIFIEAGRLAAFGENTARRLRISGEISGRTEARALRDNLRELSRRREALEGKSPVSAAAEWLLDNWYLAAREGEAAARELNRAGRLRKSGGGAFIAEAARALIRSGGGGLDAERIRLFFTGFQLALPLERRELIILPACLRAAAVNWLANAYGENAPDAAIRVERGFNALRWLVTADMAALCEEIDPCEAILRRDPVGVYPLMDERSRYLYRRRLYELAEGRNTDERGAARQALELAAHSAGEAAHIGYWLYERPLGERLKRGRGEFYIGVRTVSALFLSLLGAFCTRTPAAFPLLILPVTELTRSVADAVFLRVIKPRLLPCLELAEGIPPEGRTLCVISCLLTSPQSAGELADRLEEYRHAGRDCGEGLIFGLLADLPEAGSRTSPQDEELREAARAAIGSLNAKYGGGFYLFCRSRSYAPRDGRWMGFERKRGAITALMRLLRGLDSELCVLAGDEKGLSGVKFVLTLDSDTRLLPGTARRLVGAMLHPLNSPKVNNGRVISGHGVIHPRIATEPGAASRSPWSAAFCAQGGTDPYGSASGELWMDLTERGGFAGKGIIDVDAYLECCAALPEGRILSHDAVEGALLRGGYMSDAELMDGAPHTPIGYYARLHRWTRGDWQNLPFILTRRLPDIERWKLLDSLLRSLAAPSYIAALTAYFLFPGAGTGLAAIASALAIGFELLPEAVTALTRRECARPFGGVSWGFMGALRRVYLKALFLPWEAYCCLSAITLALWRMLVSGKNLLLWQTAAQSDKPKPGLIPWIKAALVPALYGGTLALISGGVLGRALGVFWLSIPILARELCKEPKKRELSGEDKALLTEQAALIWRYFADFLREEDNYLPPDNWQAQPPIGEARRTSPTNTGLALICCLAAADLGLTSKEDAIRRIEGALNTLEQLPKWQGHIYNWYDTATLKPLRPAYISTVDSGNLAACLLTLGAGLMEYGRGDLSKRARALYEAMDFRPLYDERRRLLHIGYDADAGELSEGVYDLLASEARLTGFLAVAKGDLPLRHWRQLGRGLLRYRGRRGLASWTGSMFEYLMPELFLPVFPTSLISESLRFCLFVQRRDTPKNAPWGQSESAFFALDPALAYRYKAHGCASLALRRGMDKDSVLAPYAAYLALAIAPHAACENIRRYLSLDMSGRYGLWEALDATPTRTGAEPEPVRCVMAHHLGMSLAAIANCLNNGAMRRRFMAEPAMRAYSPLLAERIPLGGVSLRRRGGEPPIAPRRAKLETSARNGAAGDAAYPEICPLSNGVYSLILSDTGLSSASAGGIMLYRAPEDALDSAAGLRLYLQTPEGEIDLLPLPGAVGGLRFTHSLRSSRAEFMGVGGGLNTSVTAAVSAAESAELRLIEIRGERAIKARLIAEFEPVLARRGDYLGHPAYWRLGIRASVKEGALLLRRTARGECPGCCLALASDRELIYSANATGEPLGWLNYPYVRAGAEINLAPGEKFTCRLALGFASNEDAAMETARRGLNMGESAYADMLSARAALDGLTERDVQTALHCAGAVAFPRACGAFNAGREALWRHGVSGDEPIVCCRAGKDADAGALRRVIARHALLRSCGLRSDLVILTDEGGDYSRPVSMKITAALASLGLEALQGARGGVHTAPEAEGAELIGAAALILDADGAPVSLKERGGAYNYPPRGGKRRGGEVSYKWEASGAFSFYTRGALPRRAWCQVLTNGSLGCIVADCGPGYVWLGNARETRLTPWVGDELASSLGERLICHTPQGEYSLFAAEDGISCRMEYAPGCAVWEKLGAKVTAFVPPDTDARVLIIENAPGAVRWVCPISLASERREARFVVTEASNAMLTARNAPGVGEGVRFRAAFSAAPSAYSCDMAAALRDDMRGEAGAGYLPCFGAKFERAAVVVIVCGTESEAVLRELASPDRAVSALAACRDYWQKRAGRLRVRTPDEAINRYLNYWCAYQAIACRMLARSSLYQSGGAFGFRDQLQDAVNLLLLEPRVARRRILDCCARQYREGDVMHWWHELPQGMKGVRTRCSDDLIWLAWAICEYVEKTGDRTLLAKRSPFVISQTLNESESSRYETPEVSAETESTLEHGRRALMLVIERGTGAHGLPLIGAGDWNDGMDGVGAKGRGESVWLAWFYSHTARRYAALLDAEGNYEDAERLKAAAESMGKAADAAWDGEWYRRGYYDNGAALGSKDSEGCKIDSIAQSWAQLCPEADEGRRNLALCSAIERLWGADGIIRLFDPPFQPSNGEKGENPGYIASYGPGFRENGGQYTHAALWLALGCFEAGLRGEGYALLRGCLPGNSESWGAEPYVLAADVYSCPERLGYAGWSWYTGSAGWFFRIACEKLLGIGLREGEIEIDSQLPAGWEGWEAEFTDAEGETHSIVASRQGVRIDGAFTNYLPFIP